MSRNVLAGSAASGRVLRSIAFRLAGVPLAAALVLTPALASAESCYELRQEHNQVTADAVQIVTDHPYIHGMIVGCAAGAQDDRRTDEEQAQVFAACVGLGCLFMGVDNCVDVAKRWFNLSQQQTLLEKVMRREGCAQ